MTKHEPASVDDLKKITERLKNIPDEKWEKLRKEIFLKKTRGKIMKFFIQLEKYRVAVLIIAMLMVAFFLSSCGYIGKNIKRDIHDDVAGEVAKANAKLEKEVQQLKVEVEDLYLNICRTRG